MNKIDDSQKYKQGASFCWPIEQATDKEYRLLPGIISTQMKQTFQPTTNMIKPKGKS